MKEMFNISKISLFLIGLLFAIFLPVCGSIATGMGIYDNLIFDIFVNVIFVYIIPYLFLYLVYFILDKIFFKKILYRFLAAVGGALGFTFINFINWLLNQYRDPIFNKSINTRYIELSLSLIFVIAVIFLFNLIRFKKVRELQNSNKDIKIIRKSILYTVIVSISFVGFLFVIGNI